MLANERQIARFVKRDSATSLRRDRFFLPFPRKAILSLVACVVFLNTTVDLPSVRQVRTVCDFVVKETVDKNPS